MRATIISMIVGVVLVVSGCSTRIEPDAVVVTSTLDALQPYATEVDEWGTTYYPGRAQFTISVTISGEGTLAGGGVQMTNASGIGMGQWEERKVLRGIVSSTSSPFQIDVEGITPNWDVYGDMWQVELDSIVYYRPFAIVDGLMFYGEEHTLIIGN